MDKKDLKLTKLTKQEILPGFEAGRYERVPEYDRAEFGRPQLEDPVRRDNRVNIRVSGMDMTELHRLALEEGLPVQSLLATIVHQYVNGELVKPDKSTAQTTEAIEAALARFRAQAAGSEQQD